ncbi:hypothetical protein TH47_04685 [Thalassospira sp. MCCC 1A02803]|nr:hypothetical protein AUQ41_02020 [Thalassospira sp. MCCC 1A02898]ONH89424.1 hypothetical protein TH47_04685 [Thalassospira sp. MCCC 1A02803]
MAEEDIVQTAAKVNIWQKITNRGLMSFVLVARIIGCALEITLAPSWTPACAGVTVWAARGVALSC